MTKETRMLVISAAIMMVLTALMPTALSDGVPPSMDVGPETSSRAFDNEPDNNEMWGATSFSSGEVITGSILVNDSVDLIDWYVIQVPGGSVVNASLYLIDYNYTFPAAYNLQLLMIQVFGNEIVFRDDAWTEHRWETVSYLAPETANYFIIVICNLTGDDQPNTYPANYTLSVSVSGLPFIDRGDALWGYRDRINSSSADAWVKISPRAGPDEELEVMLQVPHEANFDLYVYQIWPYDKGELRIINVSAQHGGGNLEYLLIGGSEGDLYIKIDGVDGQGFFVIALYGHGKTVDDNNIRERAFEVNDNEPIVSTIDEGRDHFDWYKVHLESGEIISKVKFDIDKGDWDIFHMAFYNRLGELEFGLYNSNNGDWPHEENPTTPTIILKDLPGFTEGDYYILIEAVAPYGWDDGFEPARCRYTIEFTLPNTPPRRDKVLPFIEMDEDTTFEGLDLSKYFSDPDGDVLSFGLGRSTKDLEVTVDEVTGEVTIVPDLDWFGTEEVMFRATDDGPSQKFVEASALVQVNPVNDPPRRVLGRTIANITLNESEVVLTEAMRTIFTDPDNDLDNPLAFNIDLIGTDMTPGSALVPLPFYNGTMDAFEVGPIDYMFGNATFKLTADDNNGSLEEELPSLTFDVTVVHRNHGPKAKAGVDDPIPIDLVEGERNDTLWVHDLIEDKDLTYTGDDLTFEFTGQVNVDADILPDGTLVFDTAGSEYYPGQNYKEDIVLKVEDSEGEVLHLNFTVSITPIDDPPVLRTVIPSIDNMTIDEGQKVEFKVIVDDDDTPSSMLNFTWYIGNVLQKEEDCSFFTFETDHSSANGLDRTIRLVVTDGTTEISHEWVVAVKDVNRAPVDVRISNPLNATVFKEGKTINFVAQAMDKDGDELTYIWYDGDTEIGRGAGFSSKGLRPGFHTIKLSVSDGVNTVNSTVIFEVRRKDTGSGATPGFETVLVLGAVTVAVLVKTLGRVRGRRRWSP